MEDFGQVKDGQEAIIFYLVYVFSFLVVRAVIWGGSFFLFRDPILTGFVVSNILAAAVCVLFGYLILRRKAHLDRVDYWGLVLLSGVLGLVGGEFLGLLPVAFLTTRRFQGAVNEDQWQQETKVPLDEI